MGKEKLSGTLTLTVGVVAIALIGIWLAYTGGGAAASLRPDEVSSLAPSEPSAELFSTAEPLAPDDRLSVQPTKTGDTEPAEEDAQATIDRNAESTLMIRVMDSQGAPISQATVRATGLRTTKDPGTWHGLGIPDQDETDSAGMAELSHRVWNTVSGNEWSDVSKLCFTVEHPSYVTQDVESSVTLDEVVVVLEQGAVLVVSGWIADTAEIVHDVRARLNYQVELAPDDWVPLRDGRLSCNKIPAGTHMISLLHERDGVPYCSVGTEFSLAAGEQVELHLQLLPPRTLRGTLDPAVPRPIEAGLVTVAVQSESKQSRAVLHHTFSATVTPEGSFEVPDLPPGEIEIIGFCTGWSSARVSILEDAQITADPQDQTNQILPEDFAGEYVLRMEATSRLRVTVLGPNGEPLEGAAVQMSPNVHWKVGFANFFAAGRENIGAVMASRHWLASTDADGVALLENLPPRQGASLYIRRQGLVLPVGDTPWGGEQRRGVWVDLLSGETASVQVQLEKGED